MNRLEKKLTREIQNWYQIGYAQGKHDAVMQSYWYSGKDGKSRLPVCHACDHSVDISQGSLNYCPNCGCKMVARWSQDGRKMVARYACRRKQNMSELKKCPFCGGKAKLEKMGFPHHVYCVDCGARVTGRGFEKQGEEDAINRWNRRADESAEKDRRIEELESEKKEREEYCHKCAAKSSECIERLQAQIASLTDEREGMVKCICSACDVAYLLRGMEPECAECKWRGVREDKK